MKSSLRPPKETGVRHQLWPVRHQLWVSAWGLAGDVIRSWHSEFHFFLFFPQILPPQKIFHLSNLKKDSWIFFFLKNFQDHWGKNCGFSLGLRYIGGAGEKLWFFPLSKTWIWGKWICYVTGEKPPFFPTLAASGHTRDVAPAVAPVKMNASLADPRRLSRCESHQSLGVAPACNQPKRVKRLFFPTKIRLVRHTKKHISKDVPISSRWISVTVIKCCQRSQMSLKKCLAVTQQMNAPARGLAHCSQPRNRFQKF